MMAEIMHMSKSFLCARPERIVDVNQNILRMRFPCRKTATRRAFVGPLSSLNTSLIRPTVTHWLAGSVNWAGKPPLVIESVRLDTKHARYFTVAALVDGAGGLLFS